MGAAAFSIPLVQPQAQAGPFAGALEVGLSQRSCSFSLGQLYSALCLWGVLSWKEFPAPPFVVADLCFVSVQEPDLSTSLACLLGTGAFCFCSSPGLCTFVCDCNWEGVLPSARLRVQAREFPASPLGGEAFASTLPRGRQPFHSSQRLWICDGILGMGGFSAAPPAV